VGPSVGPHLGPGAVGAVMLLRRWARLLRRGGRLLGRGGPGAALRPGRAGRTGLL